MTILKTIIYHKSPRSKTSASFANNGSHGTARTFVCQGPKDSAGIGRLAKKMNEPMKRTFEIRTLSDPRLLSVIRAATGQMALVAGFESKQVEHLKLAIDEVCTNIIRHTYNADPRQELILVFTLLDKGLKVDIQDFGERVDPRIFQQRSEHGTKPGGLGLCLIESMVDNIEFGLPAPVGNKCRLIKYRDTKEC
jgi:anti-sigma regulatory factor (Ser/Thr protein kinase)